MSPQHEFILDSEHPDRYDRFRRSMLESCNPRPGFETMLVEELIDAAWEVRRWRAVSARFWDYVGGHYSRAAEGCAQALFHCPEKHFRAEHRNRAEAMRNYYRALDRWQQARRTARPDVQRASSKRAAAPSPRRGQIAAAAGALDPVAARQPGRAARSRAKRKPSATPRDD